MLVQIQWSFSIKMDYSNIQFLIFPILSLIFSHFYQGECRGENELNINILNGHELIFSNREEIVLLKENKTSPAISCSSSVPHLCSPLVIFPRLYFLLILSPLLFYFSWYITITLTPHTLILFVHVSTTVIIEHFPHTSYINCINIC